MDILARIEHARFLGAEFLTWLWYRAEQDGGNLVAADRRLEVYFDGRLALEVDGDIKAQSVLKTDHPTETLEAAAALRSGKLVSEARILVRDGQKDWTFTIKATDLQLKNVKIPALLSQDEEQAFYERLALIEELDGHLETLFGWFATVRLDSDAWPGELEELRAWVAGKKWS
jgi:hypothetical protein